MKTSLIISTYNQPSWLARTLRGFSHQTRRPDEVLIADDGSDDATREVIAYAADTTGLSLKHVWHEDRGFRKTIILNRALSQATGEYLIFTDGDCVPRKDYVATHLGKATPGRFLSGGAVRLSMPASRCIDDAHIASGVCFDAGWLAERWEATSEEATLPRKLLKLRVRGSVAEVLNYLTPTRASWNGNNASCFRRDALAVNGFDERMQYGGEDREFGERLINLGLESRHVRYTAISVHLDHGRGYVAPEMIERNRAIRAETRRLHRRRTEHGLRPAA